MQGSNYDKQFKTHVKVELERKTRIQNTGNTRDSSLVKSTHQKPR